MVQTTTKYGLLGVLLFALCLVLMPTIGLAADDQATDAAAGGDAASENPVGEDAETTAVAGNGLLISPNGRQNGTQNAAAAQGQLPFKDMARYQWDDGKKAIQAMTETKIISGFPDGTFRPSDLITRRQAAKIVALAVGLPVAPSDFADVESGPSYIGALQQAGIVSGDESGRYRPNESLTRAQLAKMIVLAYGLKMKEPPQLSDVPDTDLGNFVRIAASNGVMTGYEDGTFRPNQPVKRDQAAVMIYRAMQLVGQAPGGDSGNGEDDEDSDQNVDPNQGTNDGTTDTGNGGLPGMPWSDERPFRLVVDAGHGGEDPGAVGKLSDGTQLREKDINLDIASEIVRIFQEEYAFVEVMMTRSDDTFIKLQERSRLANEWGADYFVSIHVNSSTSSSAGGYESYIFNGTVTEETVEKQRIIHQYIVENMGFKDRGMHRANFAVLRESKMPAILLENLFISNPAEAAKLNDPEFRKKLARVTAEAIALAWNVLRYDELGQLPLPEVTDGTSDSEETGDSLPSQDENNPEANSAASEGNR